MQDQIVSKIKKLRKERGYTQPQMAELLHIDTSAYARLEQQGTNTWGKYLQELCNIFEITPEKFFEGIETKVIIQNHNECTYTGNSNIEHQTANQEVYEKLIEQYEKRLKEKDEQISLLKSMLEKKS